MEREDMLRIFFVGVGGQGVLLATRLIGEAGLLGGVPVSMSEVHGMAQRGGVVESTVVLGNRASAVIGEGEADVMVAFEPLEALRALPKCHKGSLVITNTAQIPPFSVTQGASKYPPIDEITTILSRAVGNFYTIDALNIALRAGSEQAVNVVLVGFLTGLMENYGNKIFPSLDLLTKATELIVPQKFLQTNLKAFEMGYEESKKIR
ncbi:MAG: indolepyruvate oxidoreductase subunit beta [Thermodesulforhabdaceae bacterium]